MPQGHFNPDSLNGFFCRMNSALDLALRGAMPPPSAVEMESEDLAPPPLMGVSAVSAVEAVWEWAGEGEPGPRKSWSSVAELAPSSSSTGIQEC